MAHDTFEEVEIPVRRFEGFPKPWDKDGSFKWQIAQRWKLREGSGTGLIETLDQTCEIKGPPHAGRTTVSKDGASSTRSPDGSGGTKAAGSEGRARVVSGAEPRGRRSFHGGA